MTGSVSHLGASQARPGRLTSGSGTGAELDSRAPGKARTPSTPPGRHRDEGGRGRCAARRLLLQEEDVSRRSDKSDRREPKPTPPDGCAGAGDGTWCPEFGPQQK